MWRKLPVIVAAIFWGVLVVCGSKIERSIDDIESASEINSTESNDVKPWDPPNDSASEVPVARTDAQYPRDCADLHDAGTQTSGVYTIYVGHKKRSLQVYCDMTTDGGGWTVLQRRIDGMLNFYQGWTYYVNGFGSVYSEYWLGNVNIHVLTLDRKQTLRVDLTDFNEESRYAQYTDFKVGSPCEKYTLLSVGTYCAGTAGDSLTYHVGAKFSTLDQDNDLHSTINCAVTSVGAWWYKVVYNCHESNLNGQYLRGSHTTAGNGLNWNSWGANKYSFKTSEMKIRPADFNVVAF